MLRLLSLLFLCSLAQASVIHYQATLTGGAEAPPNLSPGQGTADVYIDDVAQTMLLNVSFWDLLGGVTAAHIHGATAVANTGTAGVATQTPTFTGFPSGVSFGTYSHLFDLTLASSFSAGFLNNNGGTPASAAVAFLNALKDEKAYLNVHTNRFPGGEIRGFLHNVPDASSSALLLLMGLGGLSALARARRALSA